MTIVYNGNRFNKSYGLKGLRTATIYFNDEDNFDCQAAEYVIKVLELNGWPASPESDAGYFDIEVMDREEYNELLQVYKEAKKKWTRLCAKSRNRKSRL